LGFKSQQKNKMNTKQRAYGIKIQDIGANDTFNFPTERPV
jgi:hypothetical protein